MPETMTAKDELKRTVRELESLRRRESAKIAERDKLVRRAVESREMSQADAARMLGVSRERVRAICAS